jgi:predicted TIM-barrel enzyme
MEVLERCRAKRARQELLRAGAIGALSSGLDIAVLHNFARFGALGPVGGMMPFDDANALVLEGAEAVLGRAGLTPVLAGLCGTDPTRRIDRLLEEVKAAGFAGVQNFPSVAWISGGFRQALEQTSLGFEREVEMVRQARALDLFTLPVVYHPEDAPAMLEAGADALLLLPGAILEGAPAARKARPELLVFGSPGAPPELVDGVFEMSPGGMEDREPRGSEGRARSGAGLGPRGAL